MKEEFDKQITENVPEFFFIWDVDHQKILYLTYGYKEYANVKLKQIPDYDRMLDFVHPEHRNRFKKILNALSPEDPYKDYDLKVNDEKYQAKWLNLRTFPVEDEQGDSFRIVAHISDITERKEQLNALEELKEKNEDIIRILAHDLKSPLNNMILLSEVVEKEIRKEEISQAKHLLAIIRESGKNGIKLIESMLELMELSGSRLPLDMGRVDLVALIKNIIPTFVDRFEVHRIQFDLQLPDEPVYVTLDAQKFRHVINNLVSNALKFTPAGGKVTLEVKKNKQGVQLKISDTGIGISPEKQEEIFQEFSKARRKGLHGEKSSGLGLSIAKKVVEVHQGKIWVESSEGAGSSFFIQLSA